MDQPPGRAHHRALVAAVVLAAFVAVSPAPVVGQPGAPPTPELVKDVNTAPTGPAPTDLTAVGDTLFFVHEDTASGKELWTSDGTPGGTVMVKDINPGEASAEPYDLTAIGGTLYFAADDGEHGWELWTSDGTLDGTVMVKDINPGAGHSTPNSFAAAAGTVLFAADEGVHGSEVWKTNGTEAGTELVVDLATSNEPGLNGSHPHDFIDFGGATYFVATDSLDVVGAVGYEVWTTDGTAAGTHVLKDLYPGISGSMAGQLTPFGSTLVFAAGFGQTVLHKTDGTEAGTVPVRTTAPVPVGPAPLVPVGSLIFFGAADSENSSELWKTDGTDAGTARVKDIYPGSTGSFPGALTELGGDLLFIASQTTSGTSELWRSNGTDIGTTRIDFLAGGRCGCAEIAKVGATAFFDGDDGTGGRELWKTDGVAANTSLVKDIRPGGLESGPHDLTPVGSRLFFLADDGVTGEELWTSDGTTAGTALVKDLSPMTESSSPGPFANVGGTLFFVATDGLTGEEIWRSNGSSADTLQVKDIAPGGSSGAVADQVASFNNLLFFSAEDDTFGSELWKSDGTPSGTTMVKDIKPDGDSSPGELTTAGSSLFFSAVSLDGENSTGRELWKTNGTAAGTMLVKDINPTGNGFPGDFEDVAGTLYFHARDQAQGNFELWKSDGTPAGTVKVWGDAPAPPTNPGSLTNVGGTLYFSATGLDGNELWKSDGTQAGTVQVKDINPAGDSSPFGLTVHNGLLYFSANDGVHGVELWRSDGTEGGTVQVADVNPLSDSYPVDLTSAGGLLFFTALLHDTYGWELWKTDGTTTSLVTDLNPGAAGAFVSDRQLTAIDGRLVFAATNGTDGVELWQTDGTDTVPFAQIRPGAGGSLPTDFTPVGGSLYFTADDGIHGRELWRVRYGGDTDGDGIADSVDEQPATPSTRFNDGVRTAGVISSKDAGVTVAIDDQTDPALGVSIVVTGPPTAEARLRIDTKPGFLRLKAGVSPPGAYAVTDPEATVTVSTIDGQATMELEIDGVPYVIVIDPGETASVTETTNSAGNLVGIQVDAVEGIITVNGLLVAENDAPLGIGDLSGRFSRTSGGFEFNGSLTLVSGGSVGPPLTEAVHLEVGTWTADIASTLFKKDKAGRYKYTGTVNGVRLELVVGPLGASKVNVRAIGQRTNFATFAAPLDMVTFGIGNDVGRMAL
jgi:ELWxxDGT repeat protein